VQEKTGLQRYAAGVPRERREQRDSRDGKAPHYSAQLNIRCGEKHSPQQSLRHAEVSSTSGAGLFSFCF
jgi:hypothetical protein